MWAAITPPAAERQGSGQGVHLMSYTVEALEAELPVRTYLRECVDVERFLGYCQACENYARRWSCPPFAFPPLQLWREFDRLRLFVRVLCPSEEETASSLTQGMRAEKAKLLTELLELERRKPGALALSAGSCDLCGDECARMHGERCRDPKEMRYSIEALGGDVGKTLERYFHRSIAWMEKDRVPEYLTLVGGLLLK